MRGTGMLFFGGGAGTGIEAGDMVPRDGQQSDFLRGANVGGLACSRQSSLQGAFRPQAPIFVPPFQPALCCALLQAGQRHAPPRRSSRPPPPPLFCQVGKDAYGPTLRAALQGAGVDTSLLHAVDGASGTAFVLLQVLCP